MTELKINKRRVPVAIRLAGGESLNGSLYSDFYRPDGTPANIAHRLNDPLEKFLPLAMEDRHHLLSKSTIVSVGLPVKEIDTPTAEGMIKQRVRAVLSTGTSQDGTIYTCLPPARARVLDYLNGPAHNFIPLWCDNRVVLLNVKYIASVTEMLGDEH